MIPVSKIQNFLAPEGGTSPLRHPHCASKQAKSRCDAPQNQTHKKYQIDGSNVCPWLGGTCNFDVGEDLGEGFGRRRLALGNNSDFLEE